MKLLSVRYERFRNLGALTLTPSAKTTIAVGPNGQGKTNLLEGLYFLSTLKPLRASRLAELIQFGQADAVVQGRFLLQGAERDIAVRVEGKTRTALVDGKAASSLSSYFGGVSVVAFTPDDLAVVKGGPDGRRAFLDRAVFNRFPGYLTESRDYARALKGRNRLLKDGASAAQVGAWDEALARFGAKLFVRRRALLDEVAPKAQAAFERITRLQAPARFGYGASGLSGLDFQGADEAALAQALHDALVARTPKDRERGFTSVGPHTDDLELFLGDAAARAYASQGQARALVLAWKVAEIENLAQANGFLPLLLLDDVSSELDPERNAFLMQYLVDLGAQALLSTTDAALVQRAAGPDTVWWQVEAGQVRASDGA